MLVHRQRRWPSIKPGIVSLWGGFHYDVYIMLPLEVSYNAKCDLMPRAQMSSTVDILCFFLLEHVAYMPHTIVIEKIVSQSVSQSVCQC